MSRILAGSRFLSLIAVTVSLAAATLLAVYGALLFIDFVQHVIEAGTVSTQEAKLLVGEMIELVDLLLLSTVLYVVAVGLYELFIDDLPLPGWLTVNNLDELKEMLTAVVIVVIGVSFLGEVVIWDGQRDLQGFGIGVAAVVAALTYFLSQRARHSRPETAHAEGSPGVDPARAHGDDEGRTTPRPPPPEAPL